MTTEPATDLRPFRLEVSDEVLKDLRERLTRSRFPGEVRDSGWTYGTNLAYLKELVAYWLDGYDWRQHEVRINAWPQFLTAVDGADLHFLHVRGTGPQPLPLLLSHGWPGSIVEFLEVIGPLSDPAAYGGDPADAFDVVVPSLPGYGFSADPGVPGITPQVIAERFVSLMRDVLGYPRFALQGGDWGAVITAAAAHAHPEAVVGLHLNMLGVRPYTGSGSPPITDEEQAFRAASEKWRQEETGYQWIQGTRPQTLAYALTDSPAGLAAWIVEKFRAWSDCGGDVERSFTKDELLTNIMVYWLSGCINSSTRLYYESRHHPWMLAPGERIAAPTGYAAFPGELSRPPRSWVERAVNLQRYTVMTRGGHFGAMEEPELFVEEVRAFFRKLRG
jgi:pimeloyl-ACP methyl ester carboxylesterase